MTDKPLADLIVDHYERHARDWDADRRALPWVDRPWIDLFADLLPTGGAVLDLGCGGGDPVATALAARGLRVTGVDASPTLISLCKERLPAQRWVVGDMRTIALVESFDAVLAWDSFFHLAPDDQAAMFAVFAAHAATGGVLMFNASPARGDAIRRLPRRSPSTTPAWTPPNTDDCSTTPASTFWSTSSATSPRAGGSSGTRGGGGRIKVNGGGLATPQRNAAASRPACPPLRRPMLLELGFDHAWCRTLRSNAMAEPGSSLTSTMSLAAIIHTRPMPPWLRFLRHSVAQIRARRRPRGVEHVVGTERLRSAHGPRSMLRART